MTTTDMSTALGATVTGSAPDPTRFSLAQIGGGSCKYATASSQTYALMSVGRYDSAARAGMVYKSNRDVTPDATDVGGLGDKAIWSPQGHTISVIKGSTLFALSLFNPDSPVNDPSSATRVAQGVLASL